VAVGPRTRIATSNGPTGIDCAGPVDRYLRALDGLIRLDRVAFAALERDFVAVAERFGKVRGISYAAWRDVGVSEAVLQRAEIEQLEVVAS
jgi:hypothetical protein